jgi:hypothetical protein
MKIIPADRRHAMFTVSVLRDSYLLVIVSGVGGLTSYCAVTSFVSELLKREHEDRVLVDMLGSHPALSADEHRELGQQVARLWKDSQVAVVVPSADRVLIGEQAAVAGGANIRTFTDLHSAGDWLKTTSEGA